MCTSGGGKMHKVHTWARKVSMRAESQSQTGTYGGTHTYAHAHHHILTVDGAAAHLLPAATHHPPPSTHLLSGSSKWCQCIYIRYYVHLDYDMTG